VSLIGVSEEKFWKMTPRKFFALAEEYRKANSTEEELEKQKPKAQMTVADLMSMR
jgi:hypothetical protein